MVSHIGSLFATVIVARRSYPILVADDPNSQTLCGECDDHVASFDDLAARILT